MSNLLPAPFPLNSPFNNQLMDNFVNKSITPSSNVTEGAWVSWFNSVCPQPTIIISMQTISQSISIDQIQIAGNGGYYINTGIILTINGPFNAPIKQVFYGPGNVTFSSSAVDEVHCEWFGNDLTALSNAVYATPSFGTLASNSNYTIGSTWTINKNISVIFKNNTMVTQSGTGTLIDFTASLQRIKIQLSVYRSRDWTGNTYGIKIKDMISCDVYFNAYGFNMGLRVYCDSGSINGNRFFPGELFNNKTGLYLEGSAPGYINANTGYGGRWSEDGAYLNNNNRFGIYCKNAGTSIFYGPLIEIVKGGTGKTYAMYCEAESKNNRIEGGYIEGQDYALGCSQGARFNKVRAFVTLSVEADISTQYDFSSSYYPNLNTIEWTTQDTIQLSEIASQEVFKSTDVFKNTVVKSVSGPQYMVPGFSFCSSAGSHTIYSTQPFLNESALYIGSTALGKWVDTSIIKSFWLTVNAPPSSQFNPIVICYDSSGSILSGGTHVQGGSTNLNGIHAFETSASYGGCYWISYAMGKRVDIYLADTVKSIWVGVISYDVVNNTPLNGISLKCAGNQAPPSSNAGFNLVSLGTYLDTDEIGTPDIPVGGNFSNGTRVVHLDPLTTEASGWVSSNFHNTYANGGEPTGETVIAVGSITGVHSGDIFGAIVNDGTFNKWHFTTVNGAPLGGNITITSGIPAGCILANNAKIITYKFLVGASVT